MFPVLFMSLLSDISGILITVTLAIRQLYFEEMKGRNVEKGYFFDKTSSSSKYFSYYYAVKQHYDSSVQHDFNNLSQERLMRLKVEGRG